MSGPVFCGNRSNPLRKEPTFDAVTDVRETNRRFQAMIQDLTAMEIQSADAIGFFLGANSSNVVIPRWRNLELIREN